MLICQCCLIVVIVGRTNIDSVSLSHCCCGDGSWKEGTSGGTVSIVGVSLLLFC